MGRLSGEMARLFVAVWPPPEVVAVLSPLDRPAARYEDLAVIPLGA